MPTAELILLMLTHRNAYRRAAEALDAAISAMDKAEARQTPADAPGPSLTIKAEAESQPSLPMEVTA
jgi:hypothetical protein